MMTRLRTSDSLPRKLILFLMTMTLAACGGGGGGSSGGGGSVTGLTMPEQVTLVSAVSVPSPKPGFAGALSLLGVAYSDTGTDYTNAETRTWVHDEAMGPLDIVNEILCYVGQTKADEMVNEGAYYAQIDEEKCQTGESGGGASNATQSGGSQDSGVTEYEQWTVNSTRANNSSDQIVQIWVPGDAGASDPRDAETILVEVTVSESPSNTNPFGSFVLRFKGVVDGTLVGQGPGDVTIMQGLLRTVTNGQNKPQFEFKSVSGDLAQATPLVPALDFESAEASNVIFDDASSTTGEARTFQYYDESGMPNPQEANFAIAFNDAYFLRGKDDDGAPGIDSKACLDRNAFSTQIWRYGLYHESDVANFNGSAVTGGQEVAINSGFQFKTAGGEHGHIGYWGMWVDDGATVNDGDTINKQDYSAGTSTPYIVHKSPGKLQRRSADVQPVSAIEGQRLHGWAIHSGFGTDPQSQGYDNWIIEVKSGVFTIVGAVTWNQDSPPTEVDYTGGANEVAVSLSANEWMWLWSDMLGGSVNYVNDGANEVTLYLQETVQPDDGVLTNGQKLYCYDRCPKGGVTGTPSVESDIFYTSDGTEYSYTLSMDGTHVILTDDQNAAADVDFTTVDLSTVGYDWGVGSSDMSTTTHGNNNGYLVYGDTVTFFWESGSDDWNQLTTASNSGTLASFDKPMTFNYTHDSTKDENGNNAHDGQMMRLEYGGNGDLWGFPWEYDSATDRWYSPITLKSGVVITDGTNNFRVKQLEGEQNLMDADPTPATSLAICEVTESLDVNTLSGIPVITQPTLGDVGTVTITTADEPTPASDTIAVIAGEVQ